MLKNSQNPRLNQNLISFIWWAPNNPICKRKKKGKKEGRFTHRGQTSRNIARHENGINSPPPLEEETNIVRVTSRMAKARQIFSSQLSSRFKRLINLICGKLTLSMIYEWNILKILTQPIRVIEYETYCNLNYASDLALNAFRRL